jgi:CrcB protein
MSAAVWVGVALLGGLASTARFLIDSFVASRSGGEFPFGTLTVNATGSLILGLLSGLAVTGNLLVLTGTATIGTYTTFSTWMLETHRLAENGKFRAAAINVVLSLALGIGAVALGRTIGAHW